MDGAYWLGRNAFLRRTELARHGGKAMGPWPAVLLTSEISILVHQGKDSICGCFLSQTIFTIAIYCENRGNI